MSTSTTTPTKTTTTNKKRIAVVGCGCCGLTSIKHCLDENLEPVGFESSDDIGGLWRYRAAADGASVYRSCVLNTSKEMTAFSDFPVPRDFPAFLPHAYFARYLRMYADHFQLLRHVRFNVAVTRVAPAADYDVAGRWAVTWRSVARSGDDDDDDDEATATTEEFDGVMVCTGHHRNPHVPRLRGLDGFSGRVLHSRLYRHSEGLCGKRVLVVGFGNSATDIAVELSHVAEQVFISTRRGAWVVGKKGPFGIPTDVIANSRVAFAMPRALLQWLVECIANVTFHHDAYGVKPRHRALEAHPTIHDELPHRILNGSLQVRPHVRKFTETCVIFEDGSVERVDAVILATGYKYTFPILDDVIMRTDANASHLYKYTFPTTLLHPTLCIVGLVQPIGAIMPVAELQARWFTRVMKGIVKLPSLTTMRTETLQKWKDRVGKFVPSLRHTLEAMWIPLMDELATQIGAKPRLGRLLLQDPILALRCYFGPCIPAQYRLNGPGCWPGAKQAIQNAYRNTMFPLKRRQTDDAPAESAEKAPATAAPRRGSLVEEILTTTRRGSVVEEIVESASRRGSLASEIMCAGRRGSLVQEVVHNVVCPEYDVTHDVTPRVRSWKMFVAVPVLLFQLLFMLNLFITFFSARLC